MLTRSLFLASMFALTLPACGGQPDVATDDASLDDDGKADRTSGGSSYYLIRPDLRRCAAPACGGSFVKRVNYSTTTCHDGSSQAECYVASVDYAKAGLDDNDRTALADKPIVVKASIAKQTFGKSTYGNLVVSQVWVAAVGSQPATAYATVGGTLYRVRDLGVRCLTYPCASDREYKLNSSSSRDIAGVDLQATGATDEQISDAYAAMTTTDGILVDGANMPVSGPGGKSVQLSGVNFYTKAEHQAAPPPPGGQSCGTIAGLLCPDGQWCDPSAPSACGTVDVGGTCKVTELFCAQIYLPVCGCDGKTYGNDCERVRAKVQLAHDGACN